MDTWDCMIRLSSIRTNIMGSLLVEHNCIRYKYRVPALSIDTQ